MKKLNRPVFYDRVARSPTMPPPVLGEHSDAVLGAYGIDAAERARLKEGGIIL
jgi:crotonobetainyl-CoA:carnitine CoA-transferase CaiB-like acyl-CoA transferase